MVFGRIKSRPVELWFFKLTVDGPLADGIASFVGGERRGLDCASQKPGRDSACEVFGSVSLAGRRTGSVPDLLQPK